MKEKFESLKRDLSPDSRKQAQAQTTREQALAWLSDPVNCAPQAIKLSGAALAVSGFGNRGKESS